MKNRTGLGLAAAMMVWMTVQAAWSYDPADPRTPDMYAIIFINGYAGDHFPQDLDQFEAVIKTCKEAGFNAVMTKYTDERAAILARHGMKLMVDLLVPGHHIYRDLEAVEELAGRLQDSDVIYAYHLWSDRVGGQVAGRSRDIANMRRWDPNHPTYVGDYNARTIHALENPDIIGFYDFHWTRGGFYPHLLRAMAAAKHHDVPFLKYAHANPGRPGIGNFNRVMYTIAQSTVFGLRGYMYHYPNADLLNLQTAELGTIGRDCARVNHEIAPLGPELMKISNPIAVYSTPITRTAKNDPVDPPAVPAGLTPVPDDFWVEIVSGELLVGDYRYGDNYGGAQALLVANHNAYEPQTDVTLKPAAAFRRISLFDRAQGAWTELPVRNGTVTFSVPPAGIEMLKFE